ncbi:alpha/beta fold hydrolase [Streptomyces sp. KPB2]|uniref:alpha/beta fold hydrolase n=1 Tax=Streptomyces TaxID=1883 RepID=UPI000F7146E1|nr:MULTISPECIES: alpha/beta fold hydrolase [unclassified Streptomyces]AZM77489.1 alpha/beta fold hydrolase [Streptomyces sp. KPB2]QKW63082.1 alpha/beta fold hydrolase [Streptomyces sp. NA03103]WSU03437.1 alpha/beta fold hydrolase [Streptomyces sp. NBC_01124]
MTTQRPRAYDPPRPRTVTVDGARVACWESGPGDAEPVLLLHGYPADHHCWRHQVPPLSDRYRVITPDLLGWGASERPLHLSFDYDTEVARLGRLLDALELDAVNLAGHDYGGFLSLGLAQAHPGRVRRLAILNSRAQGTFTRRWYAVFSLVSLAGRTPALRRPATRLPYAALHRRALAPLVRAGHLEPGVLDGYVDWMATPEGRRWLLHYFGDYRTPPRPELRRHLRDLTCPTAVVWGRADPYLSPAIATELAGSVPGAELTLLDDAGHWVMDERPDAVTAALGRLLERPTSNR